jgi:hypothetical protein
LRGVLTTRFFGLVFSERSGGVGWHEWLSTGFRKKPSGDGVLDVAS